jgi:hypothetical protein
MTFEQARREGIRIAKQRAKMTGERQYVFIRRPLYGSGYEPQVVDYRQQQMYTYPADEVVFPDGTIEDHYY